MQNAASHQLLFKPIDVKNVAVILVTQVLERRLFLVT